MTASLYTPFEQRYVLAIDENPSDTLKIALNNLIKQGWHSKLETNLTRAIETTQQVNPTIILLGMTTTNAESITLYQQLQSHPTSNHIPIIMMVSELNNDTKTKLFAMGVTDYVTKPLHETELSNRLYGCLYNPNIINSLEAQLQNFHTANIALEKANAELTELNKERDEFFAIVAHDLKSPFMPLLGSSEFMAEMAETLSPTEVKQMSQSIYRAANNLYKLLENLLQWSRIQRGKIDYQPDTFGLTAIVEHNQKLMETIIARKNIDVINTINANLAVYADEEMVDTIIYNLLLNAIKFTPKHGVIAIATTVNPTTNLVEVTIKNTGVGISPADRTKLFSLRQRHTTVGTDQETGLGLGLLICKHMIEKNQGEISLESELGQGTTVRFTLPLAEMAYQSNSTTPADEVYLPSQSVNENFVAPPATILQLLFDFARAGDMEGIREQAESITQMDDQFQPFAITIQQLAEGYQEQELLEFIEQFV